MYHALHRQMMLFFVVPFLLTLALLPVIIHLARKWNCIDEPGGRRVHEEPTPRWGGLAFFGGILPLFYFIPLDRAYFSYLAASFLLVVMGGIDDRRSVGLPVKLFTMLLAITTVVFGGDLVIKQLGTYGHMGLVKLGIVAIPFTYLCIIGVTNSINLIDGLNGLAGGLSLLGSLFIGMAAYLSRNFELAGVCMGFTGALAGFLLYNFGTKASIFMGDSGSLFLGFSLSVFSIMLTQNPRFHVEPMFPVLVLLVPIFDTLRVMGTRLFSGKNPFKADTTHLHHLLLARGFPVTGIVTMLWSLTLVLGMAAVLLIHRTSMPYLMAVLGASLVFSVFVNALVREQSKVERLATPVADPKRDDGVGRNLRVIRKSAGGRRSS